MDEHEVMKAEISRLHRINRAKDLEIERCVRILDDVVKDGTVTIEDKLYYMGVIASLEELIGYEVKGKKILEK